MLRRHNRTAPLNFFKLQLEVMKKWTSSLSSCPGYSRLQISFDFTPDAESTFEGGSAPDNWTNVYEKAEVCSFFPGLWAEVQKSSKKFCWACAICRSYRVMESFSGSSCLFQRPPIGFKLLFQKTSVSFCTLWTQNSPAKRPCTMAVRDIGSPVVSNTWMSCLESMSALEDWHQRFGGR